MSRVITWARKHRLSVLGSSVQPHLCPLPNPQLFRFQGSKGSQAWPVVVAPRWLAERAVVTAHLDPIIRPGLEAASAASSVELEAGLGGERRGRESASATEAGRSASRSSLPLGATRALRVTLWETPQSTSGVGLRRFCTSWALGGAAPCGSGCAGLARSGALQARGPAARAQGGGRRGREHLFCGTTTPGCYRDLPTRSRGGDPALDQVCPQGCLPPGLFPPREQRSRRAAAACPDRAPPREGAAPPCRARRQRAQGRLVFCGFTTQPWNPGRQ